MNSSENRALLRFDVAAAVPAAAQVRDAELGLHLTSQATPYTQSLTAHAMTAAWTQSATWQKGNGVNFWTHGGVFNAAAEGPATAVGGSLGINKTYRWNLNRLVRKWHAGQAPNHGVLLKDGAPASQPNALGFSASESSVTTQRPHLDITYDLNACPSSQPAAPPTAGDAPVTTAEAVDGIEEAHAAAVSAPRPETADDQTVTPRLTADGPDLRGTDTLEPSTVPKDATDGVAIGDGETRLCVTPMNVSEDASQGALVNGAAAVYANTAADTDMAVRATAKGVESFTSIRGEAAPEVFRWKIDLQGDQTLQESLDGSVAIIDPTPVPVDIGPRPPTVSPGTAAAADLRAADPEGIGQIPDPDPQAAAQANGAAAGNGPVQAGPT